MAPPMGEILPLGCNFYCPSSALQGWVPLYPLQFLSQHQPECSPGLKFLLSNRLVHHLLIQLESGLRLSEEERSQIPTFLVKMPQ